MSLTDQQLRFLETFGYLLLPRLLRDEIGWITDEFEQVWSAARTRNAEGHQLRAVVPFIDHSERLCTLLDHPRLEPALERIMGSDYNYCSGDGRTYQGDTVWHWDGNGAPADWTYKVSIYLDRLTRTSGALRVIPGSHHFSDAFAERARGANHPDWFGMAMHDLPSVALESVPGDVIIFNHNILHGAFGGGDRRRMFTMNVKPHAQTPEQIDSLKGYLAYHCAPWGPQVYGPAMVATATPNRRRHLAQVLEHQGHLPGLHRGSQERVVSSGSTALASA